MNRTAGPAASRETGLDAARLCAALAVVWIHTCRSERLVETTAVARFAVPFFAAAAAYGLVRSLFRRQPTFFQFAIQKGHRLYLPFLIWSGLYLLFKIVKRSLLPEQDCDLPGWDFWWLGGAYHLWFIPFLVASSLLLFPALLWVQRDARRYPIAAVLSAIVGLVVAYGVPPDDGSGGFGVLIGQATPGLLWGCSLGWCSLIEPTRRWGYSTAAMAAAALLVCLACLAVFSRETLIENAAGCGMLLIALSLPTRRIPAWLAAAGQLSFGIYFAHLMLLKIGESLASKLRFEATVVLDLSLFAMTVMLAAALAYACSKRPQTRWLVM